MKVIYKYQLEIADKQTIQLPQGAEFLHVDEQAGRLMAWFLVHRDSPPAPTMFYVFGTGNPISDSVPLHRLMHVGTVKINPFVWHVFMEEWD